MMSKIFLISILLFVPLGTKTLDIFESSEPPLKVPEISAKCQIQIISGRIKCDKSLEEELSKNVLDKLIQIYKEGDSHQIEEINHQLDCCSIWKTIDCIKPVVKSKCNKNDIKSMFKYLDDSVNYVTEQRCSDVPYKSLNCNHIIGGQPIKIEVNNRKTDQQFSEISDECKTKIENIYDICNQTISNIWRNSRINQQLANETISGHTNRIEVILQTIECCSAVEVIECQNNMVKSLCNNVDHKLMQKIYVQSSERVENLLCTPKAYNASECHKHHN